MLLPICLAARIIALFYFLRDTLLQCLRNCLVRSLGKPKLDTLHTVVEYMIPIGRMTEGLGSTNIDKNVELEDVRKAANACIGAVIASASVNTDTTEDDIVKLMPWCQTIKSDPGQSSPHSLCV